MNRFSALRGYRLSRYCRRVAKLYDVMISTYNVMDFGERGIQLIADFSFSDHLRRQYDPRPQLKKANDLFYTNPSLRWAYMKLSTFLSGNQSKGWKKNMTLVNSDWTSREIKHRYGIDALTIYPPVRVDFEGIPWNERENGFVCIGRLVPEKGIHKIIEILKIVRQQGDDVHLHVIGKSGDDQYYQHIEELCASNKEWVFLEGA